MPDDRDPEERSADLFDRWLAHREGAAPEAPRPRTYGVPRTSRAGRPDDPEEQAEPHLEEPEPDPPVADPPVADPPAASPPAPAPEAPATAAPREEPPAAQGPVGLDEFEPVVIASVRRAAQAPERATPRSRLSRARRRVDTDQPETRPAHDETEPDPAEPIQPEQIQPEPNQPEPIQPEPIQPEPGQPELIQPKPDRPELEVPSSEQDAQPATDPAHPPTNTPTDADAPTDAEAVTDATASSGPPRPWLAKLRAGTETARVRLDRAVRGTPEERTAAASTPVSRRAAARAEHPATDAATHPAPAPSAYEELRAQREAAVPAYPVVEPPSIDFRPRVAARVLTSALLVAGLIATGAAGWNARDSRTATDVGLVAILALLTGVVWAVRAGTVPTRVSLHGGRLEAQTQAGRFLFDLSGEHTILEMVGTPGRRGWKVLVHRRGLPPFVFTRRMVDPHQLTDALRFYRPDL